MEIRKTKKEDLKKFIILRSEYIDSLNKQNKINKKPEKEKIKKEFKNFFKKNRISLIAKQDKNIIGYISGNIFINPWRKGGCVEDLFVTKNFRRKGVAKKLLKKFLIELKKRNIKTCQLGVSKTNKKAMKLYRKIGFNIVHYEMGIKLK